MDNMDNMDKHGEHPPPDEPWSLPEDTLGVSLLDRSREEDILEGGR